MPSWLGAAEGGCHSCPAHLEGEEMPVAPAPLPSSHPQALDGKDLSERICNEVDVNRSCKSPCSLVRINPSLLPSSFTARNDIKTVGLRISRFQTLKYFNCTSG